MHSFYIIKELLVNQHRIKFLTSNNKILCIYDVFSQNNLQFVKMLWISLYQIITGYDNEIQNNILKVLETHLASREMKTLLCDNLYTSKKGGLKKK